MPIVWLRELKGLSVGRQEQWGACGPCQNGNYEVLAAKMRERWLSLRSEKGWQSRPWPMARSGSRYAYLSDDWDSAASFGTHWGTHWGCTQDLLPVQLLLRTSPSSGAGMHFLHMGLWQPPPTRSSACALPTPSPVGVVWTWNWSAPAAALFLSLEGTGLWVCGSPSSSSNERGPFRLTQLKNAQEGKLVLDR